MKTIKLNYFVCFCLILVSASFLVGCSKSGNPKPANTDPGVTITKLSVKTGPYTTLVIITGTGFSATAADDKVSFNGVPAVVSQASTVGIQTSVPLAAGTGSVTVTVNGKTVTGPTFTYQKAEVATVFAGGGSGTSTDGTGTAASFSQILALATDASGNIYVADQANNLIRKVTPDGVVTTFAGGGAAGAVDSTGVNASFNVPSGVATDAVGNVYVADKGNGLIRKITPGGKVTTLTVDSKGNHVSYSQPYYVAVDGNGNVFFTDLAGTVVREISPAGVVTIAYPAASPGNGIYGMVTDKTGNLFTVDETDNQVDKLSGGSVAAFAGNGSGVGGDINGTGNGASFYQPFGLAIDGNGNLFVNDRGNGQIRQITPAGVVTTFAGQDPLYFVGPVNRVTIGGTTGMAADGAGNFYIAGGGVIRKISFQ